VAAQFAHPQLTPVFQWFQRNFTAITPRSRGLERYTTQKCEKDEEFRHWLASFLRTADLGIADITAETVKADQVHFAEALPAPQREAVLAELKAGLPLAFAVHKRGETDDVRFPMQEESEGTQRLFGLLGPWQEVLANGSVLMVDELDASMHPLMTRKLVESFHNPEQNRHGAQLIFTTHDTSLLSPALFRRDQVWFTEKDQRGATKLYSLQEYRPRQDEALEKGYLAGRYGAVPFLGELTF